MKKIYNILAMAFMAAIVLVSCSKEDPFIPGVEPGDGQGQVSMKKMFVEIDNEEAVVRSSVDVSAFIVTISNTTKIVAEYSYQDMPEILTLPVGDYTVNVKSHEVKDAAWAEPYFVGSQSFSVEANKITEVDTVVCKLSNVKVSVKYDSKLLAQMGDDCKVNVKIGQVGELNFEKSETRSGYFKYVDGSTTMIATFSGTVQGAMEENFRTYVDVAPGKHYIITYTLHSPGGNVPDVAGDITTGVNVDSYVTTENLTINVDDEGTPSNCNVLIENGNEQYVLNISSLSNTINTVELIEGRLPKKDNEIVVEENFITKNDYQIGDTITLNNSELNNKEAIIVGTIKSPLYISRDRGTTNLGSGTINYYIYTANQNIKIEF